MKKLLFVIFIIFSFVININICYSVIAETKSDIQQSVKYLFSSGNKKIISGDYKGAIEDFNKVINLTPNNANAYYSRGLTKKKLENYLEAIEDYNIAIKLNPSFDIAYYERGFAKYKLQDYEGAIEDYNTAIKIKPNFDMA